MTERRFVLILLDFSLGVLSANIPWGYFVCRSCNADHIVAEVLSFNTQTLRN